MWFKGPNFLRQQTHITPTNPNQETKAKVLFTAPSRSFFLTSSRHATEQITSGSMWEARLKRTQEEKKLPNRNKATIELEKQMQLEAWPQRITSIHKSKDRYKNRIMSLSPFFDTDGGLIKVGGRLQLSDLTFGRKHPTLIPDTVLFGAKVRPECTLPKFVFHRVANKHKNGEEMEANQRPTNLQLPLIEPLLESTPTKTKTERKSE